MVSRHFEDCLMIILKTDVPLMVDIFKSFRNMWLQYHNINLCYSDSTPHLTSLCCSKYTNVRLNFHKEDTVGNYDTIQSGFRGGFLSVLGDCPVECKNKIIDSNYTG